MFIDKLDFLYNRVEGVDFVIGLEDELFDGEGEEIGEFVVGELFVGGLELGEDLVQVLYQVIFESQLFLNSLELLFHLD